MNNTSFTTAGIHYVLKNIVFSEYAFTVNTCGHDGSLCEIPEINREYWHNVPSKDYPYNNFVKIIDADEENGVVDIEWAIDYSESYEEAGDAWEFRYRTIIESADLKEAIKTYL